MNTTNLIYAGDKSSWLIPDSLDEETIDKLKDVAKAGHIWNAQTFSETPKQYIEKRVVGKDKVTLEEIWADYVKQFYVIRELNRLYPGWEILDYKLWFVPEIVTWVCTGVLHVRYYDIIEKEFVWRHIPGTGAQEVKEKGNKPGKAFGADQMAKAPRTDLIKNCSYWLGIAFDVYSREIPASMRSQFEDYIRLWENKEHILNVAESITNRDDFKKFLNNMPQLVHTERFLELLKKLVNPSIAPQLWTDFTRQQIKTVTMWLNSLEQSTQIKKEN